MLEQRHLGYCDALAAAKLEPMVFRGGGWTPGSGAEQVERLLSSGARPTAIMCGNDLLALGAIRSARERQLRVPEDVAVTGFDDFDFAEFVNPALTTVRVPGYEIGRTAGRMLVDVLEGRSPPARQLELAVELQLRESA
jgi:DNA-binding LacI/PurR family transcriptional regulator